MLGSLLAAGPNETNRVPGESWGDECLPRGCGCISGYQLVSGMDTGV